MAMSEFERARVDLREAAKLEPSNREVREAWEQLRARESSQRGSQDAVLGKMTTKLLYREVAPISHPNSTPPPQRRAGSTLAHQAALHRDGPNRLRPRMRARVVPSAGGRSTLAARSAPPTLTCGWRCRSARRSPAASSSSSSPTACPRRPRTSARSAPARRGSPTRAASGCTTRAPASTAPSCAPARSTRCREPGPVCACHVRRPVAARPLRRISTTDRWNCSMSPPTAPVHATPCHRACRLRLS
eukprot:6547892-Prymnesium_polylepis.2